MENLSILYVRFDIDAVEEKFDTGAYGGACYSTVFKNVQADLLHGCHLYMGDSDATLNGKENVCVIGLSAQEEQLQKIRQELCQSAEFTSVSASNPFTSTSDGVIEPLDSGGIFTKDGSRLIGWAEVAFNSIKNGESEPMIEVVENVAQPYENTADLAAVILIIRENRFVGKNGNINVALNESNIGTMDNKSFLLCKTELEDNIINLKEFKEDIQVKAKHGEKIIIRYWYAGLRSVETEIKNDVGYEEFKEAVATVSKSKGIGSLIGGALISIFMIIAGASGTFVLRFTNSSEMLVVAGIIFLLLDFILLIKRLTEKDATVKLNEFLREVGHGASISEE